MKPNKLFFTICLGALAFILLAYGLLRMKFGAFLPPKIDENVPNAVMVGAVAILLWNRKLRNEAAKAEAEKKRLEQVRAAEDAEARAVEAESTEGTSADSAGIKGQSGPDATA